MTTKLLFRVNRTFAVQPHNFAIAFATRDAVVAAVPEGFRFGTDRRSEAASDKFAIRLGPAHGVIVAAEIFLRRKRLRFDAVAEVLVDVCAQDGFTQTARAAVNEHDELLLAEVELLDFGAAGF